MKFFGLMQINFHQVSRPARGAWVEIKALTCFTDLGMGRAPQGARGLKSSLHLRPIRQRQSRPARGAWVEIFQYGQCSQAFFVAPRKGRVG